MLIDEGPIDGVAVFFAAGRILEKRRDEIEPGLDGDHVAGREREIHAERAQAGSGVFGAAGQEAAGVAHTEPDHVAEAVGKEKRVRFRFDE